MIITKKHALKLVREGKAVIVGIQLGNFFDPLMAVLTRFDKQRTDHFQIDEKQYARMMKKWQREIDNKQK